MNIFISIILFLFFFPVYAKTLKTLPLVDGKQVSIVKEKECYYWHEDEGNKKPLACVDDELESGSPSKIIILMVTKIFPSTTLSEW